MFFVFICCFSDIERDMNAMQHRIGASWDCIYIVDKKITI